jgi:hypothetical protein
MGRSVEGRAGATGAAGASRADAVGGLGRIEAAVDARHSGAPGETRDPARFLAALVLLREVREQLAQWEPELIDAARAHGASWAQLAPALGVASRQAAERRALRLRPSGDEGAMTGEGRVAAERDRRAQTRAVDAWARVRGADLRVLAAQIAGLTGLPPAARAPMAALHEALGGADAAALLQPLMDTRPYLGPGDTGLGERLDALRELADAARAEAQARRQ